MEHTWSILEASKLREVDTTTGEGEHMAALFRTGKFQAALVNVTRIVALNKGFSQLPLVDAMPS